MKRDIERTERGSVIDLVALAWTAVIMNQGRVLYISVGK